MSVVEKKSEREKGVKDFHAALAEANIELLAKFNKNEVVLPHARKAEETRNRYTKACQIQSELDKEFPLPPEHDVCIGKTGIPKVAGDEVGFSRMYQFTYKTARVSIKIT